MACTLPIVGAEVDSGSGSPYEMCSANMVELAPCPAPPLHSILEVGCSAVGGTRTCAGYTFVPRKISVPVRGG